MIGHETETCQRVLFSIYFLSECAILQLPDKSLPWTDMVWRKWTWTSKWKYISSNATSILQFWQRHHLGEREGEREGQREREIGRRMNFCLFYYFPYGRNYGPLVTTTYNILFLIWSLLFHKILKIKDAWFLKKESFNRFKDVIDSFLNADIQLTF